MNSYHITMVGSWSSSKKAIQKEVDKVPKVVWKMLMHIWIVQEYEDEDGAKVETFYTPPDSPS
jgi:DNA-directed RNA polymerase